MLRSRHYLIKMFQVGNCPRRNGKWGVENTCNQYVECSSGVERLVTCQNHLVFDEQTGDCEHPDIANRWTNNFDIVRSV